MKLIWQARSKTDPIDARKLADLLRVNLFPTIWIPDADTRRRRQLLHGRAFLVRQRTQITNRIHGRLTAENLLFARSDLYAITIELDQLDDKVKRLRRDHPMIEPLHTIPGLGRFGALFLVAESGTIERCRSSHQLAAYAGLVPATRSSGGKTSHGPVGHASNRRLKWILVEIVQTLQQARGPIGDQYRRLLSAKGKPKATTAAARKLCGYTYWMWKDGLSSEEWLARRGQDVWSEVRPVQRMGAVA